MGNLEQHPRARAWILGSLHERQREDTCVSTALANVILYRVLQKYTYSDHDYVVHEVVHVHASARASHVYLCADEMLSFHPKMIRGRGSHYNYILYSWFVVWGYRICTCISPLAIELCRAAVDLPKLSRARNLRLLSRMCLPCTNTIMHMYMYMRCCVCKLQERLAETIP